MQQTIIEQDLAYIAGSASIPFEMLRRKRLLITGGTGLIGSTLVRALLYSNREMALGLKLYVLVRDVEKAQALLLDSAEDRDTVTFLRGDVEHIPVFESNVAYVIHGAYPTASKYFSSHPVETIETGICGTLNMLKLAREKKACRFLFLSSMEAYGEVLHEEKLTERDLGYIDLYSVRSCYPESKRMCENICCCFGAEYGISTSSLRLAQTFGPGVSLEDKRVFAMMARCAINREDIVLNTPGSSKHAYLYSAQAVTAILTVLLRGSAGKAYNAANPNTYCSIYEMGRMVASQIADGQIAVRVNSSQDTSMYPPTSYLNLDITEITKLGWKPEADLKYMFDRMMAAMV